MLGNGLSVVIAPLLHLHEMHVAFAFRAGSRHETRATCGASHMLEHVQHTPALTHALEAIGGVLDAGTYVDDVVFSLTTPIESFDRGSFLLAQLMMRRPTGKHVDDERERICEEILGLSSKERLDDVARGAVFPGDPLGMPIAGDVTGVRALGLRTLRAWHTRHVCGRNAAIVVAGPLAAGEVVRLVARDWGSLPSGERAGVTSPREQTEARFRGVNVRRDDTTSVRVCLRVPAASPAAEVLQLVLGDGDAARLMRGPRVRQCYEASAALLEHEDSAVLEISVAHVDPAPVTREVLAMLRALARRGPTQGEMARMRQRLTWDRRSMLDAGGEVAEHYAREAMMNRPPRTLDEDTTRLLAVTGKDVCDLARTVVRPEGLTVVAAGPDRQARDAVRDVVTRWRGAA
jgi:predicted Zn-dependent peptidase